MANKRRNARASLDVFLNKYIAGTPYLSRARDISAEGLSLAPVGEPAHPARRVGLQFQLPGSEEIIYAEGEVVRQWGGPKEPSGVRFTLLTERHRRMIRDYIQRAASVR